MTTKPTDRSSQPPSVPPPAPAANEAALPSVSQPPPAKIPSHRVLSVGTPSRPPPGSSAALSSTHSSAPRNSAPSVANIEDTITVEATAPVRPAPRADSVPPGGRRLAPPPKPRRESMSPPDGATVPPVAKTAESPPIAEPVPKPEPTAPAEAVLKPEPAAPVAPVLKPERGSCTEADERCAVASSPSRGGASSPGFGGVDHARANTGWSGAAFGRASRCGAFAFGSRKAASGPFGSPVLAVAARTLGLRAADGAPRRPRDRGRRNRARHAAAPEHSTAAAAQ
jgi:hypothetical protein